MKISVAEYAELVRQKTFEVKFQIMQELFKEYENKWTKIYSKFLKH